MSYKIEIAQEVIKTDIKKLDKSIKDDILRAISERIAIRPYDFKQIKGKRYSKIKRLRIGNYRIIYQILEDENIVRILCIESRGKVYQMLNTRISEKH